MRDLLRKDRDIRRRDDVLRGPLRQPLARHKVVRLDLFHRVAEKIDAHGILLVDRKDIEDIAAQGKIPLSVDRRRAHIAEPDQPRRKRSKVDLFPFPQRKTRDAAREELHEALDVAHDDTRPALCAIQSVQPAEKGIARDSFFI